MSTFISNAACHGRRPSSQLAYNGRKRPHLTARLLSNRNVARFIVAPDGYGKTGAAVEYAETVHFWKHTFWVNCQSPCFLRDLDTGDLAGLFLSADAEAGLVVLDDLPALGPERAAALARDIDALMDGGCEVVACCVPSCDAYALLERDRLRLSAGDLLLSDEEVDALRPPDDRQRTPARELSAAHRVVSLAWGGDNAPAEFLRAAMTRAMPNDVLLAMASMYVLVCGDEQDLDAFGSFDFRALGDFLQDYPHLCFNPELGAFEAPAFPPDAIAEALRGLSDRIAGRSPFGTMTGLACAWADSLLRDPDTAARACDVVRALCPAPGKTAWLRAHAFDLFSLGCFYGSVQLLASMRAVLGKARAETRQAMAAFEAACLLMLGDRDGATRVAKRHAFDSGSASDARLCCLTIIAHSSSGMLFDRAVAGLRSELESMGHGEGSLSTFEWIGHAQCALADGPEALGMLWERALAAGACHEELAVMASWLFDAVDWRPDASGSNAAAKCACSFGDVERYVRGLIDSADYPRMDFFGASAGLAMEEAHMDGMPYEAGPLPTSTLLALRQSEMSVLSQRRSYDQDARNARLVRGNWADTHPDMLLAGNGPQLLPAEQRNVPTLALKLFGKFEVRIGDVPVNSRLLNRRHVATLAALMAINPDREISRETIMSAMWPDSDIDQMKKGFYSVWSNLRRAITLPDGTCPYMVRRQYGCSFQSRYVISDVQRFDEICHEFLFGAPDLRTWPDMFAEIDKGFSADFMPNDQDNAMIEAARSEYRLRLIDALLVASQGVVEAGNPQWGIWFARCAVKRDHTREDAYLALMRAQVAAGQRTAAMMTCMECRRVLSEELGMDLSSAMMALYQQLLDDAQE